MEVKEAEVAVDVPSSAAPGSSSPAPRASRDARARPPTRPRRRRPPRAPPPSRRRGRPTRWPTRRGRRQARATSMRTWRRRRRRRWRRCSSAPVAGEQRGEKWEEEEAAVRRALCSSHVTRHLLDPLDLLALLRLARLLLRRALRRRLGHPLGANLRQPPAVLLPHRRAARHALQQEGGGGET